MVWPYVRPDHEDLTLRGEVEYRARSVAGLAADADDVFRQTVKIMVGDIAGPTPLARVACYEECKWCDIPKSERRSRVESAP